MRVRLVIKRLRARLPPGRQHLSWRLDHEIFFCHSLPSAYSRRAVVSFLRKNVHNTGLPLRGLTLPSKSVVRKTDRARHDLTELTVYSFVFLCIYNKLSSKTIINKTIFQNGEIDLKYKKTNKKKQKLADSVLLNRFIRNNEKKCNIAHTP